MLSYIRNLTSLHRKPGPIAGELLLNNHHPRMQLFGELMESTK
jgi:hypothetical protein